MKKKYIFIAVLMSGVLSNVFAQQQSIYYPVDERNHPAAYIGVPFTVNGTYKNLSGDYKVEFRICDEQKMCVGKIFYGPEAKFLSTSPDDAGKDIEITVYYREKTGAWKPIRHDHARVVPAPLAVVMLEKINPAKEQHVEAYYGVEGYSSPPKAEYLAVESGGYFESQALKLPKIEAAETDTLHEEMAPLAAEYILKPTDRYKQLTKP